MQTNKEQNKSDITAINPDFLPKEYTIEDIRNFEPQLADWIEQRIRQAEIDARLDELQGVRTQDWTTTRDYLQERIAELERGSDE